MRELLLGVEDVYKRQGSLYGRRSGRICNPSGKKAEGSIEAYCRKGKTKWERQYYLVNQWHF